MPHVILLDMITLIIYHVHNSLPQIPIQSRPSEPISQRSILLLSSQSYNWSLPFSLFNIDFFTHFSFPPCMLHSHVILDLVTLIIFGKAYMKLLIMQSSPAPPPITFTHLGPNILLSTMFSNTLNLQSSLSMTKFHTHTKQQVKLRFCIF